MNPTALQQAQKKPSIGVVETVAAAERVDPAALDTPLYEVIDPEALDRLVSQGGTLGKVSFDYRGYGITVSGDGEIVLD